MIDKMSLTLFLISATLFLTGFTFQYSLSDKLEKTLSLIIMMLLIIAVFLQIIRVWI